MWVREFQSDTFLEEMEATWQGLKPLYEQVLNTNKKSLQTNSHLFLTSCTISKYIYTNSCMPMSATSCISPMVTK